MRAARLLLAAAIVAAAGPAQAATRALLVGIDAYAAVPPLRGAVNDVRDVAAVLETGGVPAVVLADGDATRAAVLSAFEAMVRQSAPGDLLYVHFSGHGISLPDDDGDEADGRDESYLLQSFDEVARPGEQLVDDDLDRMFRAAEAAGRQVLFVADACHSGSPARAVEAGALPTRLYRPKTDPTRPVPPPGPAVEGGRSGIIVAGATLDDRTIPEILIDGAPRGALSYATARALEGRADLDGDGKVVAREFELFVRQTVRNLAASKQTPQFEVPDGARLITTVAAGAAGGYRPAAEPSPLAALPPAAVHVMPGPNTPVITAALQGLTGVELVGSPEEASLVLDPSAGAALNAVRDKVAVGQDPVRDFPRIVEAHRVLDGINRLAFGGTLTVSFSPDDQVQPIGTELSFDVTGLKQPFITVFDLTATGSVHLLWPLSDKDQDPWPLDRPFQINAAVTPPYGADTLVVLATAEPPDLLRAALAGGPGVAPATLHAALVAALDARPYQIGVQAFFTAEERIK